MGTSSSLSPAHPVVAVGIRVAAVGDLQLGDSPTCVGFGFRSRYGDAPIEAVFGAIRPSLADADVVFGNLETPLSDVGLDTVDSGSAQLRGSPAYAASLRRVGFNVLNVANNHASQHGEAAFSDSVRRLESQGIAVCGLRGSPPWTSRPVMLALPNGLRVGVLGYCQRPRQYAPGPPPYAEGTATEVLADVQRLHHETDFVLVSLHWGEEFVDHPSTSEVALGRAIIDAGASAVLGHHPHVLRPIERYKHGLIAYSLGNFAGDMLWQEKFRRGVVLGFTWRRNGLTDVQATPTYIHGDYRPRPVDSMGPPVVSRPLDGLEEHVYQRHVRRTVRAQRLASYWYALRSLPRYPRHALLQLIHTTLRNKLAALRGRRRTP